ncbi:hydantoinase/oxoprolinase family protein [Acuticoccus mangrovi]|uniref:Hydantoinase/oxoprolinase family protein n=1 Tax=Acuticoccus mangrovi TaxID=2796142 RepID=A0A934MH35_9HYPH|nr:hydantoinase/oxoprolinase family protein [Acuticoccus mangrovi]MBJ3775646.1 hydantoinase/oxoprolinase family protein [Acuticoccus mangrovi]
MRIAVDIGGTFTDGIAEESGTGRIWVGKCLTTPADPGEGVSEVIAQLLDKMAADGERVEEVVHGTTLVTNTLIERRGAPTGLVVTKGTRDTLDIAREVRYDLYDLRLELPEPLVPGEARAEVGARMDRTGAEITPLDEAMVEAVADAIGAMGVSAVAVCLLHAYVNEAHEEALGKALAARFPDLAISLSSRVAREIREYERMSTTSANAYVQPLVRDYLNALGERIGGAGIAGLLRIMLSSGGFTSAEAAADTPILLLESGPAAGVISALNTGIEAGFDTILAFDMGGTTAKACVATGGAPDIAHTFEAARVKRFKKGSGLPILIPSIDLIEIGAGGGSIATIDALGLLKVGPRSAGSVPGPAAYGRGGEEATVTDADLVLGYLDANSFLGGEMSLRTDLAEAALGRLGARLGLSVTEVAAGIADIVNENMAAAARVHIAEKGLDPRAFTMVATGGAGPVHAVEVARRLRVRRLLCPIAAGAGSCLGLLAAPPRVDRAWSKPTLLEALDWDEVTAMLSGLRVDAETELTSASADLGAIAWSVLIEMRYAGQGSVISITLPYDEIASRPVAAMRESFEAAYRDLYGNTVPNARIEVVTWRLTGQSGVESRRFSWAEGRGGGAATPKAHREVYLPAERRFASAPVYDRYALPPGTRLDGPVILEERESTLVVPLTAAVEILPDLAVCVDFGEPA